MARVDFDAFDDLGLIFQNLWAGQVWRRLQLRTLLDRPTRASYVAGKGKGAFPSEY